jgi:hypothetical protein
MQGRNGAADAIAMQWVGRGDCNDMMVREGHRHAGGDAPRKFVTRIEFLIQHVGVRGFANREGHQPARQ